jgi:hypothetical protein
MNTQISNIKQTKTVADNKNKPQSNKEQKEIKQDKQDPTKYGDWQVKGRTIDF